MEEEIHKKGKYREVSDYESEDVGIVFYQTTTPLRIFFETLSESADFKKREIADVGFSLLRDMWGHCEKIWDVMEKVLGKIRVDFIECEEEPFEIPYYLGMRFDPSEKGDQKGKKEEPQPPPLKD